MATGTSRNNEENAQKRKHKTWSKVWPGFTQIYEDGKLKAECNECKIRLCAGGKAGTKSLWRHRERCPNKFAAVEHETMPGDLEEITDGVPPNYSGDKRHATQIDDGPVAAKRARICKERPTENDDVLVPTTTTARPDNKMTPNLSVRLVLQNYCNSFVATLAAGMRQLLQPTGSKSDQLEVDPANSAGIEDRQSSLIKELYVAVVHVKMEITKGWEFVAAEVNCINSVPEVIRKALSQMIPSCVDGVQKLVKVTGLMESIPLAGKFSMTVQDFQKEMANMLLQLEDDSKSTREFALGLVTALFKKVYSVTVSWRSGRSGSASVSASSPISSWPGSPGMDSNIFDEGPQGPINSELQDYSTGPIYSPEYPYNIPIAHDDDDNGIVDDCNIQSFYLWKFDC